MLGVLVVISIAMSLFSMRTFGKIRLAVGLSDGKNGQKKPSGTLTQEELAAVVRASL